MPETEPMDRQYIDDQHVVARYLADQLSDPEREAFEDYCRKHPEMFQELEAAARVKVGLGKLEDEGNLEQVINAAPRTWGFGLKHAAVFAGVLLGGAALYASMVLMRTPVVGKSVAEISGRSATLLNVSATHRLRRTRDSKDIDLKIVLPPVASAIELVVLPDTEGRGNYRATLHLETENGSSVVTKVDGLKPDADFNVHLFLNSEKLKPGIYLLIVEPVDGKERDPEFRILFE